MSTTTAEESEAERAPSDLAADDADADRPEDPSRVRTCPRWVGLAASSALDEHSR
ncbi:MAG: hypothetical protein AVDCRST_MAG75-1830 [uncultured Propionibacteriaceae bacterium]|uniref:Uncharacterized protein n=1 Tax=uncultured Propionibacteriaceae bacterium TaxID=257457 RepID=A0A6J4NYG4_9ACTN|nr:MAG: hypothetical protein AVDCRST_MAG75-1830 [uncultured Propionibacteriaceae bacterium]